MVREPWVWCVFRLEADDFFCVGGVIDAYYGWDDDYGGRVVLCIFRACGWGWLVCAGVASALGWRQRCDCVAVGVYVTCGVIAPLSFV